MLENKKKIIVIGSMLFAALIVGGAFVVAKSRKVDSPVIPAVVEARSISKAELAKNDGKEGHECLVAVDGEVYKIEDSALWQNGQHATSNGEAYCGADMTEAIGKSPHGKSKLEQLEKVGPLSE